MSAASCAASRLAPRPSGSSADSKPWVSARSTTSSILTNYVLLELGHPLHAFDLHALDQRRIVVRRARAGETLEMLDGTQCQLDEEMLVIADGTRPQALAGVMGGAHSQVSADYRGHPARKRVFRTIAGAASPVSSRAFH